MRIGLSLLAAALIFCGCSKESAPPDAGTTKTITIGMVAKSQSNPVFQAAHQGAQDAAKELEKKYGVKIVIKIQTPTDEDAQKQAAAVEQLAQSCQGIAVSCSDANTLLPAIDKAVAAGVEVMCFDSDSPKSKRFAYYGTNDVACGTRVAVDLAKAMGDKGKIAILAGNPAAPNLRARAQAVVDEIKKHPDMSIIGTFNHEETAEKAAAEVQAQQIAHPDIQGWAMIGGWPLFTTDALKWAPGTVKVVSVDALPPQLKYLTSGHVEELLAQDCYGWGYKSVDILLDKIVNKKSPESVMIIDPLQPVDKAGAAEFAKKWDKWLGK